MDIVKATIFTGIATIIIGIITTVVNILTTQYNVGKNRKIYEIENLNNISEVNERLKKGDYTILYVGNDFKIVDKVIYIIGRIKKQVKMTKIQKISGLIFAIVILSTSVYALFNNSFLAGIIGIAISGVLFIYSISGMNEIIFKKILLRSILQNKTIKNTLIIIFAFITIVIISSIINSIQNEKQQKISEQINGNYLQNIEIISSKLDTTGEEGLLKTMYLLINFKNNGDRIISELSLQLNYFDSAKYLIDHATVEIPESIKPHGEKKFKIQLFTDIYPYSKINQIKNFDIKLNSCKTFKIIKGGIK